MAGHIFLSKTVSVDGIFDELCKFVPESDKEKAINHIIDNYAGTVLHFPHSLRYVRRNKIIREKFNGQNWKAICNEFQISRTHLYRIVRRKTYFTEPD